MRKGCKLYDYKCKVIILGDSNIGKSSSMHRFTKDEDIVENHIPTIGIDLGIKIIDIDENITVKLHIWDTAGQERFNSLTRTFYNNANGIIIMYDISDMFSFSNIEKWLIDFRSHFDNGKIPIIIAGNKSDLKDIRTVSFEKGKEYADSIGARFLEISAKNGENVYEMFKILSKDIYDSREEFEHRLVNINIISQKERKVKKKCC